MTSKGPHSVLPPICFEIKRTSPLEDPIASSYTLRIPSQCSKQTITSNMSLVDVSHKPPNSQLATNPSSQTYHAYVFGTSFWYSLRGFMRIVSPATVISWFRPPQDGLPAPNDLELYTTRTDAFGLITLAALLLVLCDAVPLPASLVGSAATAPTSSSSKKPYARAMILLTIFHHITTGIGSYSHWIHASHRTPAMDIGVFGNIGLTVLGVAALMWGFDEDGAKTPPAVKKAR